MNQSISKPKSSGTPAVKTISYLETAGNFFPGIIFRVDLALKKTVCINNKLEEFLGYSNQELASLPNGFFDLIFQDDVPRVETEFAAFDSLSEGDIAIFIARFNEKDGGCRYLKNFC